MILCCFDIHIQDHRVNGVSSVSRLLGCYHLWPQVIPAPSTESVELRQEDSYIVIATDGLWKHLPYEQVVHQVQLISDPIQASKCLRDLAIAQGCQTDISVVVIKLNIGSAVPAQPERKLKPQKTIVEPEESEDEEEDAAITNIDDVITDSEEDEEDGEQTPTQDGAVDRSATVGDMEENSELDQLVLSAVHSPTTSPFKPRMKSTNFDDIMEEDEPYLDPGAPTGGVPTSTQSDLPQHAMNHVVVMPEMEYEAQTLPTTTKQRKNSQEVPVNGGYAILADTSFEQTQVRKTCTYLDTNEWIIRNLRAHNVKYVQYIHMCNGKIYNVPYTLKNNLGTQILLLHTSQYYMMSSQVL